MNVTTSQACAVTPASRVSPSSDRAAVAAPAEIWVPESSQWLSTTRSRVASDGYTWMQGVHWVAGSGLYQPRRHRRTGLRGMGPMTLYIAQLLSELSPCRPGVTYLTRRTGLTKRAVEYHLAALREAGLLAWIVRGTRVRGAPALASEFALLLPPSSTPLWASAPGCARRPPRPTPAPPPESRRPAGRSWPGSPSAPPAESASPGRPPRSPLEDLADGHRARGRSCLRGPCFGRAALHSNAGWC